MFKLRITAGAKVKDFDQHLSICWWSIHGVECNMSFVQKKSVPKLVVPRRLNRWRTTLSTLLAAAEIQEQSIPVTQNNNQLKLAQKYRWTNSLITHYDTHVFACSFVLPVSLNLPRKEKHLHCNISEWLYSFHYSIPCTRNVKQYVLSR